MWRTVLLVVAGLVAGLAAAHWLTSSTPAADPPQPSGAASAPSDLPARFADLERQLAAETERRGALEQRVGELDAQIEALRAAVATAPPGDRAANRADSSAASAGAGATPQGFGRRFRGPATGEQRIEQLVDAGFSPDRAAWIEKRTAELTMQAMQAQYAQRRGENVDEAQLRSPDQTLRTELGDADYERYLDALGRPTKIAVFNVLASSPAEKAGLKAGDQILSYGGQRVFDVRELNDLTLQGTPGQPVTLEVQRDQQTVQLVIPRGPIGIGGGPAGGQFGRRP
ncbi:MAG TPA: PDZ domain-containing protein [Gammaproteobacteria bacterium]|nr:PDZ domain-containing protein [Gammaproteobacteria bacterium]